MNGDKKGNTGADFSYFVLHDPDEFETLSVLEKTKSFDVIGGIEEYKDIVDSIIKFWGNERYLKEYLESSKLTKQDLSIIRFSPKAIEDLKFLQDFHSRVHGGGYQHALSLEQKKSIKDYPHIYNGLKLHWGKPKDFHEFIESKKLTVQDRERGGFAPEVMRELQALIDLHNKNFGLPPEKKNDFKIHSDPWNIDNKSR